VVCKKKEKRREDNNARIEWLCHGREADADEESMLLTRTKRESARGGDRSEDEITRRQRDIYRG